MADSYLNRISELDVVLEEQKETGHCNSRYVRDDVHGHVTVTVYTIPRDEFDMPQKLKDMHPDGLAHQERMSNRMRCWKLETEDGDRDVVVMRTLMPVMISNRIMFSCLYRKETEDGQYITCQSSQYNDYYYKKFGDQIGKD